MAKIEKYICDIIGCENNPQNKGKNMQIIFTTEQTEGTLVEPYLTNNNIDICDSCLGKVINSGKYITASGAQGYNKYVISSDNE